MDLLDKTPRKVVRNVGDLLMTTRTIFNVSETGKYMSALHKDVKDQIPK